MQQRRQSHPARLHLRRRLWRRTRCQRAAAVPDADGRCWWQAGGHRREVLQGGQRRRPQHHARRRIVKIIGGVVTSSVWAASAMTPAAATAARHRATSASVASAARTPALASSLPQRSVLLHRWQVGCRLHQGPHQARPRGTRCLMGSCANDPCPSACPAGAVCDSRQHCVRDPLCGMMAPDEQCKGTSACRAGKCADDPAASSPAPRVRAACRGRHLRLDPAAARRHDDGRYADGRRWSHHPSHRLQHHPRWCHRRVGRKPCCTLWA